MSTLRKRMTRRQAIKYLAAGTLAVATPVVFGAWDLGSGSRTVSALSMNQLNDEPGWHLTNPYGIKVSDEPPAWNTGHINDALVVGANTIALATDGGAVWQIAGSPLFTLPPEVVSSGSPWPNPDIWCLGIDPTDNTHFYAGGGRTLTESPGSGNVTPLKSINLPSGTNDINRIALTTPSRNIVLACDNGVYWAPSSQSPGPYTWKQAVGEGGAFSSVAAGPSDSVAAAAWGNGGSHSGIFYGDWSSLPDLTLSQANVQSGFFGGTVIPDVSPTNMARVSLASCSTSLMRMYAVSGNEKWSGKKKVIDEMLAVHRSKDGGKSWEIAGSKLIGSPDPYLYTIRQAGGNQAWYNQAVSVSPKNPDIVAVAFRSDSPFISTDGGDSWRVFKPVWNASGIDHFDTPHLHSDLHFVYFDPTDPSGKRLLFGGDGGLVIVQDCTVSDDQLDMTSAFNQNLADLQFLSQPSHEGNYGSFDVLPLQGSFLLVGGMQDNGDIYSTVGSTTEPWRKLDGGDGGGKTFIKTSPQFLIHACDSCGDGAVRASKWNGNSFDNVWSHIPIPAEGNQPLHPKKDGDSINIAAVASPSFSNSSGQLMYAVASGQRQTTIYGLFADSNGNNIHWEQIEDLSQITNKSHGVTIDLSKEGMWSLGSNQGNYVWVGTSTGRIFNVKSMGGGSRLEFPLMGGSGGAATQILADPSSLDTFAIQGQNVMHVGANPVAFNAVGMPSLPSDEKFYGFAADWAGGRLWAANDSRVFLSTDHGNSWSDISNGLPARPHCCDLRYVAPYLFLATYGRSVWHTHVG